MDFTQIMQRYVRLREKFHRGELDAEAFEEQVNSMVYKDDEGRYWQIGVESGKWYFYDGEKWVQDDLLETTPEEPEEPQIEEAGEDIPEFSVEHFFSDKEAEEPDSGATEEAFDLAFEDQLASQFAESSDSQQFDLFSDTDIFADILPKEPEGDELSAPAVEVAGLAEHLLPTQPVSIESMLGNGEEISELSDDDIDFLFTDEDEEVKHESELLEGEGLANLLFDSEDDDLSGLDAFEEQHYETDHRVVTGELGVKAEPVSEDSIKSLLHTTYDELEKGEERNSDVDQEISGELEELSEEWFGPDVSKDEFNELPWDEVDPSLAETQPVTVDEEERTFETFEVEDSEETSFDFEGNAEAPEESNLPIINTVPDHESDEMLETMQSSKIETGKLGGKKKRKWLIPLLVLLALLVVVVAVLGGIYLAFQSGAKGDSPLAQVQDVLEVQDPDVMLYDDFSDPAGGWPIVEDYSIGVSNYTSGFYYVYAINPEVPTIVTPTSGYKDISIEIESAQFQLAENALTTYGVMCRVQPNGDGYAFRITSDGQYVIEEYRNGIFQPINGWKYSEAIKANRDVNQNKILVECVGETLSLTVNGQVLDIALDDTFTEGKIGLIAQSGTVESPGEVHFDNLYLREP